jgi:hydroxyethylthiazole kinase
VDSQHRSEEAIEAAKELAAQYNCVISVSGETDYIVGQSHICLVENGHHLMPQVTGLGCTATVLTAAFAAVDDSPFKAAVAAMVTMGIAGEIAASRAKGIGSMQIEFLDALYNLSEDDYLSLTKIKVLK